MEIICNLYFRLLENKLSHWSVSRINSLLKMTESDHYLEIGVENGSTFFGIQAGFKVAVDPKFLFDFQARSRSEEKFFQVTSDDFFAQAEEHNFLFDVIFLDGLHNFSQTYRDLICALEYLSPTGFILIDDVFPNDKYSFIPDQDLALAERARSVAPNPIPNISWHGDIFKVMALIHDYHPCLHFRTFWEEGSNPQSVIWWDFSEERTKRFGGIPEISNMSYEEVLANQDILQMDSEENILEKLKHSRDLWK